MNILISGIGGHMGQEVKKLLLASYRGGGLAAGIDLLGCNDEGVPCVSTFSEEDQKLTFFAAPNGQDLITFTDVLPSVDCVVDFSHHSCTKDLLDFCIRNHLPLVLATTGQTDAEKAMIAEAAERIPLFFAANYSLGIALLIELAKQTARAFPDAEIEIVETHHDRKIDAPSGTALAIAEALQSVRPELTLHAGRAGYGKRTPNEIGISAIRMGNVVGIHEVLIGTQNQTITLKHEAYSRALFAEGALAAAAFLIDQPAGLYDMKSLL